MNNKPNESNISLPDQTIFKASSLYQMVCPHLKQLSRKNSTHHFVAESFSSPVSTGSLQQTHWEHPANPTQKTGSGVGNTNNWACWILLVFFLCFWFLLWNLRLNSLILPSAVTNGLLIPSNAFKKIFQIVSFSSGISVWVFIYFFNAFQIYPEISHLFFHYMRSDN